MEVLSLKFQSSIYCCNNSFCQLYLFSYSYISEVLNLLPITLLNHQRNSLLRLIIKKGEKTKKEFYSSVFAKGSDYSLDQTVGSPLRTSMYISTEERYIQPYAKRLCRTSNIDYKTPWYLILKRESHGIQQIHSLCVTCVSRQPTRLTKSSIRFRQKETTKQWLHKTPRIQIGYVIDVQQGDTL